MLEDWCECTIFKAREPVVPVSRIEPTCGWCLSSVCPDLMGTGECPVQLKANPTPPAVGFVPDQAVKVESKYVSTIAPPARQNRVFVLEKIEKEGLLRGQQLQVYQMLWKVGPATGSELNSDLLENFPEVVGPGWHKRLPELERKKVVRRIGSRTCEITGKQAALWDVTDKYPEKTKSLLVVTKKILSCGPTIEEACRALIEPLGWKIVGEPFDTQDDEKSSRFHWTRDITVEDAINPVISVSGWRVAGGYVVGELK